MTIPHQGIGRGRLVPSSHKGSKFRYTIVRQFSRGDERIREDKENPSLVFSGDREIPTRGSTVPVGNEVSPSFPTGTVDPRVGISRFHCTAMIDSISHIFNKNIFMLYIWRDTVVYLWRRTVKYVTLEVTSDVLKLL